MNASSGDRNSHSMERINATLLLPPEEIHLWLAFYDEITDERLLSDYRSLLNSAEKEQQARFYFAKDRLRYLITRALVRTVMSRYVPIDPRDWVFSTNAYGCPEIANAQGREAFLSFNISHTESLIVLGVTTRRALGVDVENFRAREVSIEIADRYFAPAEVAALNNVPPQQQQYRFFEYWTFKESYIKARRMGLSLPLDKFSFHYPHDRALEIAIDAELADDAARWQFWQFQPRPEYLVAICAERISDQPPRLIVHQIVPMSSEKSLSPEFLRVSK
jgi:4'-phosphopantetheinyl transferase